MPSCGICKSSIRVRRSTASYVIRKNVQKLKKGASTVIQNGMNIMFNPTGQTFDKSGINLGMPDGAKFHVVF